MKQSAKNGHQHHHHLFVNEGEGFDSALTESVCTTWRELAAQTSATQATDFIVLHRAPRHRLQRHWTAKENRPSAQRGATQATDLIVHHLSPYVVQPGATGCRGRLDFTETSKGRLSYYGGRQHLESLPTEIRHDQVYLAKLPASYSWRPPCGIWVSHQIR